MLDEFDIFIDFLKQHDLRWTPQRKSILKVFLQLEGHVAIDDLHKKIRSEDPTIGIATLYRTMKLLIDAGLAEMHTFNERTTYERLYQVGHHDHLICKICGKTVVASFFAGDLGRLCFVFSAPKYLQKGPKIRQK